MRHYCTLFDSKYLPQGLVLYESLQKHSSEPFRLNALPLDEETERALESLQLPNLIVLGRRAFEADQDLLEIQNSRTHQEYAWTCASNLCEWLLFCPDCDLSEITYLDADLMFFSDPKVIFEEMDGASIAVIPHRLTENDQRDRLEKNGKFNVSWVTFKNDWAGKQCLARWSEQCRKRCSADVGCGDQKYLDEWPDRYGALLRTIKNIGAGLAPWNLQTYGLYQFASGPPQLAPPCDHGFAGFVPVVFYHYHETRFDEWGAIRLTNYPLRMGDVEILYKPYIAAVNAAKERIASVHLQSR